MTSSAIIITVIVILILGFIIFPFVNKWQFNRLPFDQKVRILMKQAKGLIFFKNISNGKTGTLIYVKNKRKIYLYPWELRDGKMLCTRKALFEYWDYPEEKPAFQKDEIVQALSELEKYNKKNAVKLYLDYDN